MANNEKEKNLEFAEIIKEARGDRSLREYAEDSGVSYMTIYKAERGECVPSPKTIKKLSSIKAKPQNGATYERMMVAAGYQDNDAVSETASVLAQNMVEEMYESDKLNNNGFRFSTAGKIDVSKQELYDEYLRKATGIIITTMIQRDLRFANNGLQREARGRVPNISLDVMDCGRITQWWFIVRHFEERKFSPMNMQILFANLLFYKITKDTKLSIVLDSKNAFGYLVSRAKNMPYRGELSAILIDVEKQEVVKEEYLSNYFEHDHSEEFFLA